MTDCCIKQAAAAHYCDSQTLFQVRNQFPPERGGLHRVQAYTHREAGHLGEISHRSWVMCSALCLVYVAACRCACPRPQAPLALRAVCRGCIRRACSGQQTPVDLRDISLGPWAVSPVSPFLLSVPFEGNSKTLYMIISGKQPSRSCWCSRRAPSRTFRIAGRTVEVDAMIFCRGQCPAACFLRALLPVFCM